VAEIPAGMLRVSQSPSLFAPSRGAGVYSYFGRGGRRGGDATFGERVAASLGEGGGGAAGGGKLGRGARVRHPSLGEGVILELEGEGDHAKYTVFFNRAGKRKLLARYADLEPL